MDNLVLYILVFGIAAEASRNTTSWLQCYQCDPSTHTFGACSNPVNNVGLLNCTVPGGSRWRISCFSTFLSYSNVIDHSVSNNRTGIRRGCSFYPATNANNPFCNSNPGMNVTRISCKVCETSACNSHTFNATGNITGSGGSGGNGGDGNNEQGDNNEGTSEGIGSNGERANSFLVSIIAVVACILILHIINC